MQRQGSACKLPPHRSDNPAAAPCRLLRHEVGEVSNRRAWADPARLTPDLLALYRRPLRVEGWDMALVGVSAGGGERWHGWMVGPQGKFARPTVDHIRGHNSRGAACMEHVVKGTVSRHSGWLECCTGPRAGGACTQRHTLSGASTAACGGGGRRAAAPGEGGLGTWTCPLRLGKHGWGSQA